MTVMERLYRLRMAQTIEMLVIGCALARSLIDRSGTQYQDVKQE
jgi:hypothetical protein